MELQPQLVHAPELFGNFWLNADEPVSIRENMGNIILVDFWDYSCINCIRTLPYIQEWRRRYREFGLVVVGVHTPEFKFAQTQSNVEQALQRFAIDYPVVMDNDALVWSAYANRYWPTRHLIDKNGCIRFTQHGEGGYEQFERAIQQLLVELGYRKELPDLMPPLRSEDKSGAVCFRATGELYGGFLRSSLGNQEGVVPESTLDYEDPGYYVGDRFYAKGPWRNKRESLCFMGETGTDGWLTLRYEAATLNAVLAATDQPDRGLAGGHAVEAEIEQDGAPLTERTRGMDVELLSSGRSVVNVELPRMYELVKNASFGEHVVRLKTKSPNLELFTFSFSSCVIPEFVHTN